MAYLTVCCKHNAESPPQLCMRLSIQSENEGHIRMLHFTLCSGNDLVNIAGGNYRELWQQQTNVVKTFTWGVSKLNLRHFKTIIMPPWMRFKIEQEYKYKRWSRYLLYYNPEMWRSVCGSWLCPSHCIWVYAYAYAVQCRCIDPIVPGLKRFFVCCFLHRVHLWINKCVSIHDRCKRS